MNSITINVYRGTIVGGPLPWDGPPKPENSITRREEVCGVGIKIPGRFMLALLVLLTVFPLALYADEPVPRTGQEQLRGMLNDPSVTILDARTARDWRKSDSKIKGAVRVDPFDVSSWIGNYPKDRKIVVYCA
jgi:hypothetical protein